MSGMSDARAELATILGELDLTARFYPTNVNPWDVVVHNPDPMLTNENTIGSKDEFEYNLLLDIVGGGPDTWEALETKVENILLVLGDSDDWFPGDAGVLHIGDYGDGKLMLTVTLPVTKIIEITGGN